MPSFCAECRPSRGPAAALALSLLTGLLTGCAPAVVVVGAATYGAAVVHDRRAAQTVLDDEAIELKAKAMLVQDPTMAGRSRVRIISFNHAVLLAGQADDARIGRDFASRVAALPKVARVYNELEIGRPISLGQQSEDTLTATRGKVALASIPLEGFDPTRVKVIAENGSVYLMGLVTPAEADASAEKVRRLPGVKRVVKLFDYLDAAR